MTDAYTIQQVGVRVGQVWEDLDRRGPGRRFKVVGLITGQPFPANVVTAADNTDGKTTVLAQSLATGRQVRIAAKRMLKTGAPAYRLVGCSADTDGDGGCGRRYCPECIVITGEIK